MLYGPPDHNFKFSKFWYFCYFWLWKNVFQVFLTWKTAFQENNYNNPQIEFSGFLIGSTYYCWAGMFLTDNKLQVLYQYTYSFPCKCVSLLSICCCFTEKEVFISHFVSNFQQETFYATRQMDVSQNLSSHPKRFWNVFTIYQ